MDSEKLKDNANRAAGKAKEDLGKGIGSERLVAEGKTQEIEGKIRETAGDVKEAGKDILDAADEAAAHER